MSLPYSFTPKAVEPSFPELRKMIAWKLASLAKWIYPDCPQCMAFMTEVATHFMIHGTSMKEISWPTK